MKTTITIFLCIASSALAQSVSINVDENHNNHKITSAWLVPRVLNIGSSGTPAINTDNYDAVLITTLSVNITSMTSGLTGTPVNFQKLIIRFKDDGSPHSIAWGSSFESSGATLPTTTIASKVTSVGLMWFAGQSKWKSLAVDQEP